MVGERPGARGMQAARSADREAVREPVLETVLETVLGAVEGVSPVAPVEGDILPLERCGRQAAAAGMCGDRLSCRHLAQIFQRFREGKLRLRGEVQTQGQIGADEKTRTFTPVKEQRPQRCASTNSATSALIRALGERCLAKVAGEGKGENPLSFTSRDVGLRAGLQAGWQAGSA